MLGKMFSHPKWEEVFGDKIPRIIQFTSLNLRKSITLTRDNNRLQVVSKRWLIQPPFGKCIFAFAIVYALETKSADGEAKALTTFDENHSRGQMSALGLTLPNFSRQFSKHFVQLGVSPLCNLRSN